MLKQDEVVEVENEFGFRKGDVECVKKIFEFIFIKEG